MPYRVLDLRDWPNPEEANNEDRIQDMLNDAEADGWSLVQTVVWPDGHGYNNGPYFVMHKDKPGTSRILA